MKEIDQKNRFSCLGILGVVGGILTTLLALLTALNNFLLNLPQHFMFQISGFQINIGLAFIIAIIFSIMIVIVFCLGVAYPFIALYGFFKKGELSLRARFILNFGTGVLSIPLWFQKQGVKIVFPQGEAQEETPFQKKMKESIQQIVQATKEEKERASNAD